MYHVVEFADSSIAIVHHSWMVDAKHCLWSSISGKHLQKLLLNELPPPAASVIHEVTILRTADIYPKARYYEAILEEQSDVPSSDATTPMIRGGKRRPAPVTFEEFEVPPRKRGMMQVANIDIDYSPPPSPIKRGCDSLPVASSSFVNISNITKDDKRKSVSVSSPTFSSGNQYSPTEDSRFQSAPTTTFRCSDSDRDISSLKGHLKLITSSLTWIAGEVKMIRETNDLILRQISKNAVLPSPEVETGLFSPLPLRSPEEVMHAEKSLQNEANARKFLTFCSHIGGTSIGHCTRNVMARVFSNECTRSVNWRGSKEKFSISCLKLTSIIIEAVKSTGFPDCHDLTVKDKMQNWIFKARRKEKTTAPCVTLPPTS